MRKRSVYAIVLLIFLFVSVSFAQQSSLLPNLRVYTLRNNFTILINEEKSSSMPRVDFVCRAGYSHQGRANAGFLDLYSKLFLSSADPAVISRFPVISSSNGDSVTYSCNVRQDMLEEYLYQISLCAVNPTFKKEDIENAYNEMKSSIKKYQSSAASFLNSAIESRMFPKEPWKQSFGIDLKTFSSYSVSQVTAMLEEIRSAYYTPDNSMIIISGNVDAKSIARTVSSLFAKWEGVYSGTLRQQEGTVFPKQKKYVIVSDMFSSDMTQVALQFTDFKLEQAKALEFSFAGRDSSFKSNIYGDKKLGVRSPDYLSVSSTWERSSVRLILQGLMEEPFAFSSIPVSSMVKKSVNCVDQIEGFVTDSVRSLFISADDFAKARNELVSQFDMESGGGETLAKTLCQFWANNENVTANSFFKDFAVYYDRMNNMSYKDFVAACANQTPFVFAMVNTSVYKKYEKSFKEKGYEAVTQDSAAWYSDSSYNIGSEKSSSVKENVAQSTIDNAVYSKYYVDNARTLKSHTLSNDIPFTVKNNQGSKTVTVSLAIAGGTEKTIAVNALADNVQRELGKLNLEGKISRSARVESVSKEAFSYITVDCLATEVEYAFVALYRAIEYGAIDMSMANALVDREYYQMQIYRGSPSNQMRSFSLSSIYKGTEWEKKFGDTFSSVSYGEIESVFNSLKDASLYSVVVVGDVLFDSCLSYAEKTLGLLKIKKARQKFISPSFKFKPESISFKLDKASLSPYEKTTNPMQMYFVSPSYPTQKELFNALLFELEALMAKDLGGDVGCKTLRASSCVGIGMIECTNITRKKNFTAAFSSARKNLEKMLKDKKSASDFVSEIKRLWHYNTMLDSQSNSGTAKLIQEGIVQGNASTYLDCYLVMENATPQDFLEILDRYITEKLALQVFTKD